VHIGVTTPRKQEEEQERRNASSGTALCHIQVLGSYCQHIRVVTSATVNLTDGEGSARSGGVANRRSPGSLKWEPMAGVSPGYDKPFDLQPLRARSKLR